MLGWKYSNPQWYSQIRLPVIVHYKFSIHEIIIFFKFSALGLHLNIIYLKKMQILASIKKKLIQKESVSQRFYAMNFLIATVSSIFMCAGYNNTAVYFF